MSNFQPIWGQLDRYPLFIGWISRKHSAPGSEFNLIQIQPKHSETFSRALLCNCSARRYKRMAFRAQSCHWPLYYCQDLTLFQEPYSTGGCVWWEYDIPTISAILAILITVYNKPGRPPGFTRPPPHQAKGHQFIFELGGRKWAPITPTWLLISHVIISKLWCLLVNLKNVVAFNTKTWQAAAALPYHPYRQA